MLLLYLFPPGAFCHRVMMYIFPSAVIVLLYIYVLNKSAHGFSCNNYTASISLLPVLRAAAVRWRCRRSRLVPCNKPSTTRAGGPVARRVQAVRHPSIGSSPPARKFGPEEDWSGGAWMIYVLLGLFCMSEAQRGRLIPNKERRLSALVVPRCFKKSTR